jgi:hypothetical protein
MSKNEVDWNRFRKEYYRTVGATVIKALAANGFQAAYAESRQEAVDAVLSLVPEGATVGIPGSVTIRELGLPEILEARGNRIVQHWDPALQADERAQRWNDELASDIFLTSSNAVTLAGELVNIDGTGNRVAGMAWANNRICFVVGINKVSRNVESALQRILHQGRFLRRLQGSAEGLPGGFRPRKGTVRKGRACDPGRRNTGLLIFPESVLK